MSLRPFDDDDDDDHAKPGREFVLAVITAAVAAGVTAVVTAVCERALDKYFGTKDGKDRKGDDDKEG